jgi:hypothetical protein
VAGKLTIKGKTADVTFPLAVKKDGATQVFDGALPIKRLTYNIGEGEWKDTGMVADEVTIKFHIVPVIRSNSTNNINKVVPRHDAPPCKAGSPAVFLTQGINT